jgi:hypothetical protein
MIERLKRDPCDLVSATQITKNVVKLTQGIDFTLIQSDHFADELKNDGCTLLDALNVLEAGRIFEPPEADIKTGELKYRVHGKTIDNVAAVVVEIFISGDDESIKGLVGLHLVTFWTEK